jgi:hypothetical protein
VTSKTLNIKDLEHQRPGTSKTWNIKDLERCAELRVFTEHTRERAMFHQDRSHHSRRGWGTILAFAATFTLILAATLAGLGELPTPANVPAQTSGHR